MGKIITIKWWRKKNKTEHKQWNNFNEFEKMSDENWKKKKKKKDKAANNTIQKRRGMFYLRGIWKMWWNDVFWNA